MSKLLVQGDVFLVKIDKVPTKAKASKPQYKGWVLAEGEATGHAHRIEEKESAELFTEGDKMFLHVHRITHLTHEEHKPIALDPGVYEVGRIREWDQFDQEARRVQD